jgi:hypothetical protein
VTTATTSAGQRTDDAALDAMVAEDPREPGRHYARLVPSGHHVWAVIAGLRGRRDDIAKTARDWHISEREVLAAVRYYERYRDVFDAFFLLQQEEADALNRP